MKITAPMPSMASGRQARAQRQHQGDQPDHTHDRPRRFRCGSARARGRGRKGGGRGDGDGGMEKRWGGRGGGEGGGRGWGGGGVWGGGGGGGRTDFCRRARADPHRNRGRALMGCDRAGRPGADAAPALPSACHARHRRRDLHGVAPRRIAINPLPLAYLFQSEDRHRPSGQGLVRRNGRRMVRVAESPPQRHRQKKK